jgi:hypothetical protein
MFTEVIFSDTRNYKGGKKMPRPKKVEEKPKRKYVKRDDVAKTLEEKPLQMHCTRFEPEQWAKLEKLQKLWDLNRSATLRACVELAWRYRGEVRK